MILYISDLDGTLLNEEGKLSNETIQILKPMIEDGFPFTIATGRELFSAIEFIEDLNVKLPVVLSNGAYIYDPLTKKIIHKNCVDIRGSKFFLELCSKNNLYPFIMTLENEGSEACYYKDIQSDYMKKIFERRKKYEQLNQVKVNAYDEVLEKDIVILYLCEEESILRPLYEVLLENDINCNFMEDINNPGFYWLDVINQKTTKGYGVSKLKSHLKAKELVCFGDQLNDISMFQVAEKSYAMDNADDKLKAISKGIIGRNDEHSVARFLENLNMVG